MVLLEAGELNLKLNADLAVLSACENRSWPRWQRVKG